MEKLTFVLLALLVGLLLFGVFAAVIVWHAREWRPFDKDYFADK